MFGGVNVGLAAQKTSSGGGGSPFNPSTNAPSQAANGGSVRARNSIAKPSVGVRDSGTTSRPAAPISFFNPGANGTTAPGGAIASKGIADAQTGPQQLSQDNVAPASEASVDATPARSLPDFASLTTEELGREALTGARTIGRVLASGGGDAEFADGKARIAGVRTQLEADGATESELIEFDQTVDTMATQRALGGSDNINLDRTALSNSRNALENTTLNAFQSTDAARSQRLSGAGPVDEAPQIDEQRIATDIDDLLQPVFDGTVDATDSEFIAGNFKADLILDTIGALDAIASTAASGENEADEGFVESVQGFIAGIREQLVADGASSADMEVFDETITRVANSLALEILGLSDAENSVFDEIANLGAFESTETSRNLRLESNPDITVEQKQEIDQIVTDATNLVLDDTADFGDLTLSGEAEIGDLLGIAADLIGRSLRPGTEVLFASRIDRKNGQEAFQAVRQELIANRSASPDELRALDGFFALLVEEQSTPPETPGRAERIESARENLQVAINNAVQANEPFADGVRIKDTASFEGTNGADPVTIYTVELAAGNGLRAGSRHQEAVENVIEEQLQEVGQGYELTNLEASGGVSSVVTALRRVAAAAPEYVNVSLGSSASPEFIDRVLQRLGDGDSDLVADLDLGVPASPDNFDSFKDIIREVALNTDEYLDELGAESGDTEASSDTRTLRQMGEMIEAFELVIAAGTQIFGSLQNDDNDFAFKQFVNDEPIDGKASAGSITLVGNISAQKFFETDEFFLTGETLPENAGIAPGTENNVYRGEGVDVYAAGTGPVGRFGESTGTSFASPDMLVNAVLGRFDPNTEQRIVS